MKRYSERISVYEDEVIRLGGVISGLKSLCEYYASKTWLTDEDARLFKQAKDQLDVARARMKDLTRNAQLPLW